jgi:hypothetical protein
MTSTPSTPCTEVDRTVGDIAARLAEIAHLAAELARAAAGLCQALTAADPDRGLLELLARRTAGETFTAGSLLELAAVDPVLREALAAWPTALALGCRLRELSSYDRGGFRLEAAGRDKFGMIWEARLV